MAKRRDSKFESQTVSIRRVAKVTAGGKRLRFSAMVVVGDKQGKVGVALGRGVDTRSAIEKGIRKAEKNAKKIELVGDTIPHEIMHKKGAAKVMLRPAKPGTGVIAGSSVRTVLELAGIENVYGKIMGSSDLINNAYATFEALTLLRSGRVLKNMKKMEERLHLKEQLDKERKERERRMREKANKDDNGKKGRDGRGRGDRRGRRDNRRRPTQKVEAKAETTVTAEAPTPAKSNESPKSEE